MDITPTIIFYSLFLFSALMSELDFIIIGYKNKILKGPDGLDFIYIATTILGLLTVNWILFLILGICMFMKRVYMEKLRFKTLHISSFIFILFDVFIIINKFHLNLKINLNETIIWL